MMRTGLVFNIQKYSVHDGPGIRTTVFLKGCPLNCAWCHNPESISPRREILALPGRCIDCAECRRACPYGGVIAGAGALPVRPAECTLCSACVNACPTAGRRMVGEEMSVPRVLKVILQDQLLYEESGGGVTFSGGEPLWQPEFLRELIEACHAHGIHTTVDTCGLARWEHLQAIAALTDLFLYDLKLIDETAHMRYTGVSNRTILSNLEALGRSHRNLWIRVPVIPGINDSEANLEATAHFVAAIPSVRQVNLLPFHRLGLAKDRLLGRTEHLPDLRPPTPETMTRAGQIFTNLGLTVRMDG
jgi:pyruvate formate lyase activating enzyme